LIGFRCFFFFLQLMIKWGIMGLGLISIYLALFSPSVAVAVTPPTVISPDDVDVSQSVDYRQIEKWAPKALSLQRPGASSSNNAKGSQVFQVSQGHTKAAEIESLMAGYIGHKLERVSHELSATGGNDDVIFSVLRGFCREAQGESAEVCGKRYIAVQTPILAALRSGMIRDHDTKMMLDCGQKDESGKCLVPSNPGILAGADGPQDPKGQVAYLPTFSDLQAYAKARGNALNTTPAQYDEWKRKNFVDQLKKDDDENWYSKNVAPKPIKEDFIKTIQVQTPDSVSTVFMRDSKGQVVYDEKAFQDALAVWEEDRKTVLGKGGSAPLLPKTAMKIDDIQKKQEEFLTHPVQGSNSEYEIYSETRAPLVLKSNETLTQQADQKKGTKSVQFVGSKKKAPDAPAIKTVADGAEAPIQSQDGGGEEHSVVYDANSFSLHQVVEYHKRAGMGTGKAAPDAPQFKKQDDKARTPASGPGPDE
jgi:hypothetical protein